MASWKDDAFHAEGDDLERAGPGAEFIAAFPNLADFFAGDSDITGKCVTPPGSLSLWMEDGKLKACWKLKAASRVGFTVVHEPAKGFHQLEAALCGGLIEWRKEGVRKRS